jgi:ribose 5-phosphate isomerase B
MALNDSGVSVDYPDYALKAAEQVREGKARTSIVICHSGIGVSVSANKMKGIRAALCQTVEQAELARKHTDANVLALPAGFVTPKRAKEIVVKWLTTDFEGGRHERRIEKIKEFEERGKC